VSNKPLIIGDYDNEEEGYSQIVRFNKYLLLFVDTTKKRINI
jgi:hypothetical protein